MSRRKANTTINLSLRFLYVQELHGKTLANFVVDAYRKISKELISDHNKDCTYLIDYKARGTRIM